VVICCLNLWFFVFRNMKLWRLGHLPTFRNISLSASSEYHKGQNVCNYLPVDTAAYATRLLSSVFYHTFVRYNKFCIHLWVCPSVYQHILRTHVHRTMMWCGVRYGTNLFRRRTKNFGNTAFRSPQHALRQLINDCWAKAMVGTWIIGFIGARARLTKLQIATQHDDLRVGV
jgi:hypothetical protein